MPTDLLVRLKNHLGSGYRNEDDAVEEIERLRAALAFKSDAAEMLEIVHEIREEQLGEAKAALARLRNLLGRIVDCKCRPWPFRGEPDCGQHDAWFAVIREAAEAAKEVSDASQ